MEKSIYDPDKSYTPKYAASIEQAEKLELSCNKVDLARCKQDIVDEHAQAEQIAKLKAELKRMTTQYRLDRSGRYDRFQQLRGTLEGAFRKDPTVKAMLTEFRRKSRRRTAAGAQPPEQQAPSAHTAAATPPAPAAEMPSNRVVAQA